MGLARRRFKWTRYRPFAGVDDHSADRDTFVANVHFAEKHHLWARNQVSSARAPSLVAKGTLQSLFKRHTLSLLNEIDSRPADIAPFVLQDRFAELDAPIADVKLAGNRLGWKSTYPRRPHPRGKRNTGQSLNRVVVSEPQLPLQLNQPASNERCHQRVDRPGPYNLYPSHRATTALARQLPTTLTEVRAMSISASMPSSTATPSMGR